MVSELKALQPIEYYKNFYDHNIRPDGRGLTDFRPTSVNIGSISTADGSAVIKQGNTTVCCGIKLELGKPKADEPKKGYIVPNIELGPLCSPRFKPGPPSELAQVSSQFIVNVLSNSKCFNLEDLCVVEGEVVWVCKCDMICLDYDGSILDACLLSIIAALNNVSFPKVCIDAETEAIQIDRSKNTQAKVIAHPVATTVAVFEEEIFLTDPTDDEECLASSLITIVTVDDKICAIHKPGGSSITPVKLQECINQAKHRAQEVTELIEKTASSVDR